MRLKNKETGEIRKAEAREDGIYMYNEYIKQWCKYELPALAEQWEYYEESKKYFTIDSVGHLSDYTDFNDRVDKIRKEIGNYFGTREEAEKAVEKLKAWKRLRDKGFRFVGRSIKDLTITYSFDNYDEPDIPQMNKDLDLLFGGEDEA